MTILLGLDIETTGLNPAVDKITELGFVAWDVEKNIPLTMGSKLILEEPLPDTWPEFITSLTGITKDCLNFHGVSLSEVMLNVINLFPHYLVAHNADFEKSFLLSENRLGLLGPFEKNQLKALPWIDTKTDIPYTPGKGQGSLSEIAMSHGVFNPLPHRGLTDTLAMMQVLSKYDINQVILNSKAPSFQLVANVSYADKQKAKDLGYYWNGEKRLWIKNVKEYRLSEEKEAAAQQSMSVYILEDSENAI